MPREPTLAPCPSPDPSASSPPAPETPDGLRLTLLTAAITTASFLSTVMSVHLLAVLRGQSFTLVEVVAFGALIGPSQVVARALELVIARRHHPIWTKVAASTFVIAGLGGVGFGGTCLTPGIVLYGAGIGLDSIVRGTLPLTMVGQRSYPVVMGRIARSNLIAQAVAPLAGSVLITAVGTGGLVLVLSLLAAVSVCLSVLLLLILRRSRPS